MESRKDLDAEHTRLETCSWYAHWQLFRYGQLVNPYKTTKVRTI